MEDKNYTVPLSALKAERAKGKQKLKLMEEKMEELVNINQEKSNITESCLPPLLRGGGIAEGDDGGVDNTPQTPPDYLAEFADLVKNPTYADSAEHIDEIREYAAEHGVSLKTAYNSLFAEEKYEKIRQKAEMESIQKLKAKQARKVEAVDGGSGIGKKVAKLNATQLAVAEMCGMTPEEYARYM